MRRADLSPTPSHLFAVQFSAAASAIFVRGPKNVGYLDIRYGGFGNCDGRRRVELIGVACWTRNKDSVAVCNT